MATIKIAVIVEVSSQETVSQSDISGEEAV